MVKARWIAASSSSYGHLNLSGSRDWLEIVTMIDQSEVLKHIQSERYIKGGMSRASGFVSTPRLGVHIQRR